MRKIYLIISCFLSLYVTAQEVVENFSWLAEKKNDPTFNKLKTFTSNSQMGLVGYNGEVVLKPIYDVIIDVFGGNDSLSNNLFSVHLNNKQGLYRAGEGMLLPVEYDYICASSILNVLAYSKLIISKNYELGIFDLDKGIIVPVAYKDVAHHNGYLFFKTNQNELKLFTIDGEPAFADYKIEELNVAFAGLSYQNYSNEEVLLLVTKNGKRQVLNLNGELIYPDDFVLNQAFFKNESVYWKEDDVWWEYNATDSIEEHLVKNINLVKNATFTSGFSIAQNKGEYGVINKLGEWVIEPDYDLVIFINPNHYDTREMGWMVRKKELYGYYNKDGVQVLPCKFDRIDIGYAGTCFLNKKNDKMGLYSAEGEVVIAPQYEELIQTPLGYFIAKQNGNWNLISSEGVVQPKSNYANQRGLFGYYSNKHKYFSRNFDTYIRPDKGLAVVNKNGIEIVPQFYDTLIYQQHYFRLSRGADFHNYFLVKKDNKFGLVSNSEEIIPPIYDYLNEFEFYLDSLIPFSRNGQLGYLCTNDLTERLVGKYDDCAGFKGHYAVVSKNGKKGIVDRNLKEQIPLHYDGIKLEYNFYSYSNPPNNAVIVANNKTIFSEREEEHSYGVYSLIRNKEIVPVQFESIKAIGIDERYYNAYSKSKDSTFIYDILLEKPILFSFKGTVDAYFYNDWNAFLINQISGASNYYNLNGEIVERSYLTKMDAIRLRDRSTSLKKDSLIVHQLMAKYDNAYELNGYDELSSDNSRVFLVSNNKKYGIIDEFNQVRVPMKYGVIGRFDHNELTQVSINDKIGFINKKGDEVIPVEFDEIMPLELKKGFPTQNYFLVKKEGSWGLMDNQGEYRIQPVYENIDADYDAVFHQRILIREYFNYKYGRKDERMYYACEGDFEAYNEITKAEEKEKAQGFYDEKEINSVKVKNNGLWGLMSFKGDTLIPFENESITYLSANQFIIKKKDKYQLKDLSNDSLLPIWCDSIFPLKYMQARTWQDIKTLSEVYVYEVDGKFGLVDLFRGLKTPPIYDAFEACFCRMEMGWDCFFMDEGWVGKYHSRGHNSTYVIRFKKGNKLGLLNTLTLQELTSNLYDEIKFDLVKGNKLFIVKLDQKMTFLINEFSELYPATFDYVSILNPRGGTERINPIGGSFSTYEHYYRVQNNRLVGLYDVAGLELLPIIYQDITNVFYNDLENKYQIVVKQNDKYGIINAQGDVLVPFKYDKILIEAASNYEPPIYLLTKKNNELKVKYNEL